MFLSDAIKKRARLEQEAKEMDDWFLNQQFGTRELKWQDMKAAIQKVIDGKWNEWQKYEDAIEKDINQLELEIN